MRQKFEATEKDEVYIHHDRRAGVTIAAFIKGDQVFFARSVCSENDQFCYKIGRHIAIGRALKSGKSNWSSDHSFWQWLPKDVVPPVAIRARREWIIKRMIFLGNANTATPFWMQKGEGD